MKKVRKKHIEATRFYFENNDAGLTKTEVAQMFDSDRHEIVKLSSNYQNFIESSRPQDKDFMFLFSEQEEQAVEEYSTSNVSKSYILKKYNIGKTTTLDNWLSIYGYSTDRHYQYNLNRHKFEEEPDEQMAYWIGFLTADGYIGRRNNGHLSVELHLGEKDKEHIKKFARFLEMPENEIDQHIKKSVGGAYTKDNVVYRFSVFSNEMALDLAKYGIVRNKSLKEKPYIFNNKKLEINYIRGLIDGDGFVSSPKSKENRLGLCGSKEICSYVSNFFKQENKDIFISDAHFKQLGKNQDLELWYWQTTNREATKRVLRTLYNNDTVIYLDRKYNNACAVLKSLNEAGRLSPEMDTLTRTEGQEQHLGQGQSIEGETGNRI